MQPVLAQLGTDFIQQIQNIPPTPAATVQSFINMGFIALIIVIVGLSRHVYKLQNKRTEEHDRHQQQITKRDENVATLNSNIQTVVGEKIHLQTEFANQLNTIKDDFADMNRQFKDFKNQSNRKNARLRYAVKKLDMGLKQQKQINQTLKTERDSWQKKYQSEKALRLKTEEELHQVNLKLTDLTQKMEQLEHQIQQMRDKQSENEVTHETQQSIDEHDPNNPIQPDPTNSGSDGSGNDSGSSPSNDDPDGNLSTD